jgi:hypothetical protein
MEISLLKRPVFHRRAVVARPPPTPTTSCEPGPLVRSHLGPTVAELRAMIDDGRLTIRCVTPEGKKLYDLDRDRLGMNPDIVAPMPTFKPIVLERVPEVEEDEPVKVVKKKPTALEKTLKNLTVKKFVRKH